MWIPLYDEDGFKVGKAKILVTKVGQAFESPLHLEHSIAYPGRRYRKAIRSISLGPVECEASSSSVQWDCWWLPEQFGRQSISEPNHQLPRQTSSAGYIGAMATWALCAQQGASGQGREFQAYRECERVGTFDARDRVRGAVQG